MEIRIVMKTGIINYSFSCLKEFEATVRRYESDPAVKMTVIS